MPTEINKSRFTNKLIFETSPYLLQHAHNPVNWLPWSDEAFELAKSQDKPVLVSIGYSACHWCHVMERESFEDLATAEYMNNHFINIKVDREERPDVDHIYMDAVQAITGSGGWPLNVFLTPDRKPFYGGTYFPASNAFNRPSWKDVLYSIAESYKKQRTEIEQQAENLINHIGNSTKFNISQDVAKIWTNIKIKDAFDNILRIADPKWGGFGGAPKFPQTFSIQFLLNYSFQTQNNESLGLALLSLNKMIQGGIYDHIGGGFSRYSTDNQWLAPHFEKMLYDNALIMHVLSDAYQLTKTELYKSIIKETFDFINEEMKSEEGGFYSALDADSDGEEGKYYVWESKEVKDVLKEDYGLFSEFYDISENGNWEQKNILRILKPLEEFAFEKKMNVLNLSSILENCKKVLKKERSKKNRPQLDDKILLGWNSLMNKALSKAFGATGDKNYLKSAYTNMDFILKNFQIDNESMYHTWKNGKGNYSAFLDDYAFLISALIELGQVSAKYEYFQKAKALTQYVLNHFSDDDDLFFYYTGKLQKDVPLRKIEIYDGATPSGNSAMALNLYKLSIIFDISVWKERAEKMIGSMSELAIKYPTSFGLWLSNLFELQLGSNEIVLIGEEWEKYLVQLLSFYIPNKIVMAGEASNEEYPLMANKGGNEEILIYLCRNYSCKQPVTTIERLISLLSAK